MNTLRLFHRRPSHSKKKKSHRVVFLIAPWEVNWKVTKQASSVQRLVKLAPFLMSPSVFGLFFLPLGDSPTLSSPLKLVYVFPRREQQSHEEHLLYLYSMSHSLVVLIMKGSALSRGIKWNCYPLKWKIKCTDQNVLLTQIFVALFYYSYSISHSQFMIYP